MVLLAIYLQKSNHLFKKKLKKKWRFWREFKFFFLRKRKKKLFYKIKWWHNQKRIIWKQLCTLYGKKVKKLNYKKNQTKFLFGSRFFDVLSLLELRLSVLILRMGFYKFESKNCLKYKDVTINGVSKKKYYTVRIGDVICRKWFFKHTNRKKISFKKRYIWRWWFKKNRNKTKRLQCNRFWLSKKSVYVNYIEVNFKLFGGILLRKPKFGEIILENKKRMLTVKLFKKAYYPF